MAFPVLETLILCLDYFVGKGELVQIRWGLEFSRNSFCVYAVEKVQNASPVNPHCDHCRGIGWSHHLVSKSRYHFIIPPAAAAQGEFKLCVLDMRTHLLHGMLHSIGFGHLISLNGREKGYSKFASGCDFMDLWDRICSMFRASGNELRVALNAGSDPSRSLAALHQRRLPCAEGYKEDTRHMFDKTPLRDSTPNKDLVSVSAQTTSAEKGFGNQQRTKSSDPFQILIVLISRKSMLHWVRSTDLVQDIKLLLGKKTGIPAFYLRLLCAGKQLEDTCSLSCYNIQRNDSITLSMRLRGGTGGQSSSAAAFSYKDAVHSQKPKERAPPTQAPKPFIVDKSDDIPSIELEHPVLDEQHQVYAERGIICRFNGLWPNIADLYHWIHTNWSNNCKVFFCSKGFFITVFMESKDYQKVLTKGPWFWNSAGLFLTPWFPEFDPSTAVITKLPIWVRLPNLPAHLWSYVVFEAIGNSLGRFLETDISRGSKGLYTYAKICAEIDISKGLPDQIILKIGDFHWSQPLDFENTAFRCRNCHLTGHLQSSCPTLPFQKKKAKAKPKSKSWKPHDRPPVHVVPSSDDEVDSSSDDEDVDEDVEVVEEMSDQVSPTVRPEEVAVPPSSQKRTHESSPSESDKELSSPAHHSLQTVLKHQDPNGWVKVGKKKGKKSRPSDSTLGG